MPSKKTFGSLDYLLSINTKSLSQAINMTRAASGSTGITVADNDNIDFGTGNFTLYFDGLVSDFTPVAALILMQKWATNVGYELGITATTGYVYLKINTTTYTSSVAPTAVDGTLHKIVSVVTVGAVNTTVDFYFDGVALGAQQTANPGTVSNAAALYILGTSAVRTAGIVSGSGTFNRALTAAEVLDLYRNGIAEADKWGSQTAVYTSNFSAGVDSWAGATGTTLTGNVDQDANGVGNPPSNDWLKIERTGAAGRAYFYRSSGNAVALKSTKFTVTLFNPAGSTLAYFQLRDFSNAANKSSVIAVPAGTEVTVSDVSLPSALAGQILEIYPCSAAGVEDYGVATGTVFYMKNFISYQTGVTLALESSGIQPSPGQWLDSSTNKLHALQPSSGSSLTQPKYDFTFKATIEWSASNTARHINVGNIDQVVLTSKHYITSIISKVTVSTSVQNIEIGDGSDVDRYVASVAPSGTQDHTLANNINDGTNLKLVVTPAGSATMTIEFTVLGIILE